MGFSNSKECANPSLVFFFVQLLLVIIPSTVKATFFNFPTSTFETSDPSIKFQGDAYAASGSIQLTKNAVGTSLGESSGRALYAHPVRLWDSNTGQAADFNTYFTFNIAVPPGSDDGGDGLAFFLAPSDAVIPSDSFGGRLGIFSSTSMLDSSQNQVVAVEFDTYSNPEWSEPAEDHVGIDINSINSSATAIIGFDALKNITAQVWINYDFSTLKLSVYFVNDSDTIFTQDLLILSYALDFSAVLPESVSVGFSAATGLYAETHTILSWTFNSTEFPSPSPSPAPAPAPAPAHPPNPIPALSNLPLTQLPPSTSTSPNPNPNRRLALIIGSVVGVFILLVGVSLIVFVSWKKSKGMGRENPALDISTDDDDEYEKGTGPTKFTYDELVHATNNFAQEGKLGEGGFGGVYRGVLSSDSKTKDVAVKKVSKESKQGKKEFVSEVKIISQLRHRNLVQLIGWCKKEGEFLLVYELMPNGSLDFHLFKGKSMLSWSVRYKIARGLGEALLYLHEGWEQCVVHRDIKSSNVMLDTSFNAKLGDFGLARFVDHDDMGVKTTMLAGTMGYMAPECMVDGKAGKESDVYSFGVVLLEIACGRRVVEPKEEKSKVGLIAWVWELYGSGRLFEAVDAKLCMVYDLQQTERLMVVGLWCASLDYNRRPSIKQAISVLNFEAPLPDLPSKMSIPTHFSTYVQGIGFSYASSSSTSATNTQGNLSLASSTSHNTSSSNTSTFPSIPGISSSAALLRSTQI